MSKSTKQKKVVIPVLPTSAPSFTQGKSSPTTAANDRQAIRESKRKENAAAIKGNAEVVHDVLDHQNNVGWLALK